MAVSLRMQSCICISEEKSRGKTGMKFGVDLITFYNPAFWGVKNVSEMEELSVADPAVFWRKIFSSTRDGGIEGLELTFPPFDWRSLLKAFGSIEGVRQELAAHQLSIVSAYFVGLEHIDIYDGQHVSVSLIEEMEETARFVAQLGGKVVVAGLPARRNYGAQPPVFVDMETALPLASILNRIGARLAVERIDFALHTEAHTVFCAPRDIDLFLLLTDPRYVHFCPDTAHILLEGGDPVSIIARYQDRIRLLHWKDAIRPMPRETPIDENIHERHRLYFCEMGKGKVDFPALAGTVREVHRSVPVILELDASSTPVDAITNGYRFAERIFREAESS